MLQTIKSPDYPLKVIHSPTSQVAGWTPSQYVAWLYSHPYEVVDMIQGTIQWYEDMIRESGAPSFDPIYPNIIQLLQTCKLESLFRRRV